MKILQTLMLAGVIAFAGCATAPKMNRLSLGMTKDQVFSTMGRADSTSAPGGGVELLYYKLSPKGGPIRNLITEDYMVRLENGKVVKYGKLGEFDAEQAPK